MSRASSAWPWVALASALAAVAAAIDARGAVVDSVAIVVFLLIGPGLALVPLLRLPDVWGVLTLAAAVSIALESLLATAMLYAGLWSPATLLFVLVLICIAGVLAQMRAISAARRGRR